jgi:sulfur-carrier protein
LREDQKMRMRVTVRYFAAARAAAGHESETIDVAPGTNIDDLVGILSGRGLKLAEILRRCSFLRDGVAVRDRRESLQTSETVDVLPPFAGG